MTDQVSKKCAHSDCDEVSVDGQPHCTDCTRMLSECSTRMLSDTTPADMLPGGELHVEMLDRIHTGLQATCEACLEPYKNAGDKRGSLALGWLVFGLLEEVMDIWIAAGVDVELVQETLREIGNLVPEMVEQARKAEEPS